MTCPCKQQPRKAKRDKSLRRKYNLHFRLNNTLNCDLEMSEVIKLEWWIKLSTDYNHPKQKKLKWLKEAE